MTILDDFASATEVTEVANADPINVTATEGPAEDAITLDRKIGATRASVTLTSGTTVSGDWAAGDSQAFRRLIQALVEVTDGATARVDRAVRQIDDMTTGIKTLREDLRTALDDIEGMHTQREVNNTEQTRRIGELMAEITQLKADLGSVQAQAITPDVAGLLRERAELTRERDQSSAAFATEKRRADTAVALLTNWQEHLEAKTELRGAVTSVDVQLQVQEKVLEAARAADQAFEEAKWKEGGRYLKLANMWIGLLNAVAWSEGPPQTEPPT